jgi:hypothetical protein
LIEDGEVFYFLLGRIGEKIGEIWVFNKGRVIKLRENIFYLLVCYVICEREDGLYREFFCEVLYFFYLFQEKNEIKLILAFVYLLL